MFIEYLKLVAVLFSATGFWKLAELLFKVRMDKRRHTAEIRHLDAQAEKQISENWIQWSQVLERRVKELEAVAEENKELKRQIDQQRERVSELESKVERVEKENQKLRSKVQELTNSHSHD